MASPISRPGPAAWAAGPMAAKTPAPIMEPSPITTASVMPSRRAKRLDSPVEEFCPELGPTDFFMGIFGLTFCYPQDPSNSLSLRRGNYGYNLFMARNSRQGINLSETGPKF